MSETTMYCPIPPALDHAKLRDPQFTIRGRGPGDAPVLAHYDPDRNCGGLCYLVGEVWAIYGPLPFSEFFASLGARGVSIEQSSDLSRWVTACAAQGGPRH